MDLSKRIFGLDILRAVGIMFVVTAHGSFIFTESVNYFTAILQVAGIFSVESLFVLSGFLIGDILLKEITSKHYGHSKLRYFLIRRWFRTLPNYFLILILSVLISIGIGENLPDKLWTYFLFVQNTTYGLVSGFFGETWSLTIEEWSYLIAPALIVLSSRIVPKFSKHKQFLTITIFMILFFIAMKISYMYSHNNDGMMEWNLGLRTTIIYRMDAIFYGFVMAYIYNRYPQFWNNKALVLGVLGAVVFVSVQLVLLFKNVRVDTAPVFWNVIYLPLCSICIGCIFPFLTRIKRPSGLLLKTVTHISIISYGTYLIHYSVVMRLMQYYMPTETLSFNQKLIFFSIYGVLSLILGHVLYKVYEKPMMNLRDHPVIKKRFDR